MNTYDTAHMLHHLRQWQSAMQAAEQRLDALSELTGIKNEYVSNGETATGPYCALQALDDKNCDAIWPRRWYTKRGDTLQLDLRSGT